MCGEGSDEQAESAHVVDRAVIGVGVLFEVLLVTIEEDATEFGNRRFRNYAATVSLTENVLETGDSAPVKGRLS